jgi:hypothetical protein
MSTKITVEDIAFPLTPWIVEGTYGERMQPIAGTWTLAPETLCRQGIKGIISCPNALCKQAALIGWDMGAMDNGCLQLNRFQCAKCGFLCNARLQAWDTRKLFCVAYELLGIEDGKPTAYGRKEYLHAENRGQALAYFVGGTGYLLDHANPPQPWRLVNAAIAIGYFGVESDKDQINLTVD